MTQPAPVVGRLAPSPTGGLHLGHARTFLVAWLAARSSGGRIVLRIEDIDRSRVRPGTTEGMIEDLRWLGLDWDQGPELQSERFDLYRDALARLKASGSVYPCTCSRSEIARAASAPHAGEEGPSYPGTCARRSADDAKGLGDRPFSWRFRVPPGPVRWEDLIRGPIAIDPVLEGADFVVGRSDGSPAYQLAVVCDDAAMGVNQVIRGDDLILSTPRQILLHSSFGNRQPDFGHLPLVLDAASKRLAKRDGSIKLATLREGGADPRRLIGLLASSLGFSDEIRATRPSDWIGRLACHSGEDREERRAGYAGLDSTRPAELAPQVVRELGALPKEPWRTPEAEELGKVLRI